MSNEKNDEKYMFPELSWRISGSTYNTVVEHGVSLNRRGKLIIPPFQRELVWTVDQKIKFVESLVLGFPIGEYTLHKNRDFTYELLDGQQRWNAIFCYMNNEFEVFGVKYDDLNQLTKFSFESKAFPHRVVEGLTQEQKLDVYNRLAYGGTPHEIPQV